MNRRKARESVLLLMFESDFDRDRTHREILDTAYTARELEHDDYIEKNFIDIEKHLDKIDAEIAKHLVGWSMSRISRVSAAVLRVAVYEILFSDDVGTQIAINEAVELAKKYGDDKAPAFVNGVLGNIASGSDTPVSVTDDQPSEELTPEDIVEKTEKNPEEPE